MIWTVNSEWQHYMQAWRHLCDIAMLNNGAHQARKLSYTGHGSVAGPAYDQQREEARIALQRGRLDHEYHWCTVAPDIDYSDPADPRLFDEDSKRKIKQWRCQEEVRQIVEAAEAAFRKRGDRPTLKTTARAPARMTGFPSTQQVTPQEVGTATSHVNHQEASSDPEFHALEARAQELDRYLAQGRYSQRARSQGARPSSTIMGLEYHLLLHQANPALANVPSHTRAGGRSSSRDAIPSSSPPFASSGIHEEFAVAQYDSGEAVGAGNVKPFHALPSHRLTLNPESERLLSRSLIEAILEAGDSDTRPLVVVKGQVSTMSSRVSDLLTL